VVSTELQTELTGLITDALKSMTNDVFRHIKWTNGEFRLQPSAPDTPIDISTEIPPIEIIPELILNADESWPFKIEPNPRNVGSMVELLRGCRFYTSRGKNDVIVIPDRGLLKSAGAFDTPEPIVQYLTVAAISPLCNSGTPPDVADIACGAGYFLIAALDIMCRMYPSVDPILMLDSHIKGLDIDPVAVEMSRRNLKWYVRNKWNLLVSERILTNAVRCCDALDDLTRLPLNAGRINAVIGNPPYQFLSGRGSPVAALQQAGKDKEARKLSEELMEYTARFPDSSIGCHDKFKWFIDRAVEILAPNGHLGFITPNTWLAYPRYRDIRKRLTANGRIDEILDFSTSAFSRAHVPTATLLWTRDNSGKENRFPLISISKKQWRDIESGVLNLSDISSTAPGNAWINKTADLVKGGIEPSIKTIDPLDHIESPHWKTLGDIATIREGSHAYTAVQIDIPRKPAPGYDYPVIIDKTIRPLIPPETGYIAHPQKSPGESHHTGERFFIRKTGDNLIVAPHADSEFAVAHQNVYIGKVIDNAIPLLTLVGILNSSLLTSIYRNGPGGQHKRPHAQLRLVFLRELPIVIVPPDLQSQIQPDPFLIENYLHDLISGASISPQIVPRILPADHRGMLNSFENIALIHEIIARLVAEYIHTGNVQYRVAIDVLVCHLYGGMDFKQK
jgi:hypothetical protein